MTSNSRVAKIAFVLFLGFSLVLCSVLVYADDGDLSVDFTNLLNEPLSLDSFISDILSLRGSLFPLNNHPFHHPASVASTLEMHEKSPPALPQPIFSL